LDEWKTKKVQELLKKCRIIFTYFSTVEIMDKFNKKVQEFYNKLHSKLRIQSGKIKIIVIRR